MLIHGLKKYISVSHKFDEIEKNGHYICNYRPKNSRKKVVRSKKHFGCSPVLFTFEIQLDETYFFTYEI